jgi:hypothetical protein
MPPTNPTLVFIGHPGHELRIHGWISRTRPPINIITDGSGSASPSRIGLSAQILKGLGSSSGPLFGAHTDRAVYNAILTGNHGFFLELAAELLSQLSVGRIRVLVSDASEGYNPTHDICHLIASAAATRARRSEGMADLIHYVFPLTGDPKCAPALHSLDDIVVDLTAEETGLKIAAALDYARKVGGMLLSEVEETRARYGEAPFQHERLLHQTAPLDYASQWAQAKPFYEQHGEKRRADGHYSQVIRCAESMLPIAKTLKDWSHASS